MGPTDGSLWGGESYLDIRLEGELPEASAQDFGSFLERRPTSLRTLVESLDRAAKDPQVKALVVRVGFLPDAGWGKVQELRDAIARYRKSGKPAYAHLEFCGNRSITWRPPARGSTPCPPHPRSPPGGRVMFFRNTLDKLGV